jgi:hypothetical protein
MTYPFSWEASSLQIQNSTYVGTVFLIKTHLTTGGTAMKQNIHNVERVIRVVLGLIIFSLVFVGPKSLWGLIGILPIMTGLIGWCPPYQLLGISTCKK